MFDGVSERFVSFFLSHKFVLQNLLGICNFFLPFLTNSTRSNQKTKTLAADHTHSRHSHNHIILNITLTRLVSIFKSFHLLNYSFLTSTKQGSRNRHLFRSIFGFLRDQFSGKQRFDKYFINFVASVSLFYSLKYFNTFY